MTLGGLALVSGAGGTVTNGPSRAAPEFTVLLAGRDIVYCYYRQPCKDQNQRTGLTQPPNTDTLMLVKVNGTQVKVLSIPRDTNVGPYDPSRGKGQQKVNMQYYLHGPEGLLRAAETITGERVDSYVIVRTDYVERVINALGGLDVTVPEGGIEWVDQAAGVDLKLSPGEHHLDGKTGVLFLRVRKGFGDDYGRMDHQKQALTQLAARLRSPQGLAALPTILGGIGDGVETNLDPGLLATLQPYLGQMKLSFATLPTEPIPGTFNLAVDRERLSKLWGDTPVQTSTPRQAPDVTLKVVDASGATLGPALARALQALGYEKVEVESAPASREPSQVFTTDAVDEANLLADALQLPRLQGERFPVRSGQVGILLGMDARQSLAALGKLAASPSASGAQITPEAPPQTTPSQISPAQLPTAPSDAPSQTLETP
ncbi:LCP family protein [Deinococcus deserti]